MESHRLLIKNIRQLVQVTANNDQMFLRGEEASQIQVLEDDQNRLAILVGADGMIADLGLYDEIANRNSLENIEKIVDANGGVVLPGLVDGHSHPVFAGDRVHEFAMKLAGATYAEVQAAGGGIHFTTAATRKASEEELYRDFEKVSRQMLSAGTTTLEAKSGYGLETETEMKMLRVLDKLSKNSPLEISATFCGAHAVPRTTNEDDQTKAVAGEMLDAIIKAKSNGELQCVENIDVFCEKGNFGVENTERILKAGEKAGLHANFHAEELNCLNSAEMGARIGARAMSHLEKVSPEGIKMMAASGTVAVLLPSTAFILRLEAPPARELLKAGVIVALGSDFNPNAWCPVMPQIMHMACIVMKMSIPEVLAAATINSAHSIGRGKTHGALHKGRVGDLLLLNVPKWEHLVYRSTTPYDNTITHVFKLGKLAFEAHK